MTACLEGVVRIVEAVAVIHQVSAEIAISKLIIVENSCVSHIPTGQDLVAKVSNKAVIVQSSLINPLLKITKTKSPLKGSRGILLIDGVDSRAGVSLAEADAHWIVSLFVHVCHLFEPLLRRLVQGYDLSVPGWPEDEYHTSLSVLSVSCHCPQLQVSWLISDVIVGISDAHITVHIVLSSRVDSNILVYYSEVLVTAEGVGIDVHRGIASCLPPSYILDDVTSEDCFHCSASCLWEGSGGGQGGSCSSSGRLCAGGGLCAGGRRVSGWGGCTGGCLRYSCWGGRGLGVGSGTGDTFSCKNEIIKVSSDRQCIH